MVGPIYEPDKERLGSTPGPDSFNAIFDPSIVTPAEDLDRWVLDFPYAKNRVPMNGSRGSHQAHARKVRAVRANTAIDARLAGIPPLGRCQVQLTWYVLDAYRRDAVNLSNLLKAMQDGLVDANVVPDDTPDLMDTIMSRIVQVDNRKHREAWMELTITRWEGLQ